MVSQSRPRYYSSCSLEVSHPDGRTGVTNFIPEGYGLIKEHHMVQRNIVLQDQHFAHEVMTMMQRHDRDIDLDKVVFPLARAGHLLLPDSREGNLKWSCILDLSRCN